MIVRTLEQIAKMVGADQVCNTGEVTVHGISTDTRSIQPDSLFVPLVGERFDGHDFAVRAAEAGAAAALWAAGHPVPDGLSLPLIFVPDTLAALGRLAGAYQSELSAKVIGITGSNGKTGTKDYLAAMLGVKYKTGKTGGNLNNHIGVPLTLLSLDEDTEMAVVEMGTSDFGEIRYLAGLVRPDVAILTNVGEAHLDRLGTVENVAVAKLEMTEFIHKDGLLITGGDQSVLRAAVAKCGCLPAHLRTFGEAADCTLRLVDFTADSERVSFETAGQIAGRFTLHGAVGRHGAMNAMAAMLAADFLGLTAAEMNDGLLATQGAKMRSELLRVGQATIMNDAYKSNPASLRAALSTFYGLPEQRKLFVMGDMVELGATSASLHAEIGAVLDADKIETLFAFGPECRHTAEAALPAFGGGRVRHFDTLDELAEAVIAYAAKPCAILFKASRALKFERLIERLVDAAERAL